MEDAKKRWFDASQAKLNNGADVVLTLDEKIQYVAERELDAAIAQTHAIAGTAIVMNPNNGEILALANWPTFNPNKASEAPTEARMDRAVSALYEPGSTFKLITLAAAFNEGITRPDEVFDCENGSVLVAGHRIHDHKRFGLLNRFADSRGVERRGRDQNCAAAASAPILRLHSRVWLWRAHGGRFAGREPGASCGR